MTTTEPVIPGQMTFDDALSASAADSAPPLPHRPEPAGPVEAVGHWDQTAGLVESAEPVGQRNEIAGPVEGPGPALVVEIIRSPRRRKTAQARMVGSTLEVRIPARCSADEEHDLVEHFRTKFERARATETTDLAERAAELAARFSLPMPETIRWVSNQESRWGSCTPVDRSIRLSDRLVGFPSWVVDYVIVHELAHLVVDTHSAEFWALVDAYPLTERARGYLIAKSEDG